MAGRLHRHGAPAITDIATWRMVPGDTIAATQALDVALVGDNLSAELALGGLGVDDLQDGVTVTYDVLGADGSRIATDVTLDQAAT